MPRLALVGGGHSHVQVLRRFTRHRPHGWQLTLVSPSDRSLYSGMLPGVIAGHYSPAAAHLDLRDLCAAAGAELVLGEVTGIDTGASRLRGRGVDGLDYSLLSINCGAAAGLERIPGAAAVGIPVKPVGRFLPRWSALLERLRAAAPAPRRIAVVGGGIGGVELVLAIDHRLRAGEGLNGIELSVIDAAPSLLAGLPPGIGGRLAAILARRGVSLLSGYRVEAAAGGVLQTTAGAVAVDEVLWAIDAAAPGWPGASGLATDAGGFVRVDACLRSLSHPHVFAAGDVASFAPQALPKAGVFAVREGTVLADNLLRTAAGRPLRPYRPQRRYLSLVSTGDCRAVALRGRWIAEGRWVWRWKDRIDRRFVER